MKILWVNPSFLDYRVPVYHELDRLTGGNLHVIYSKARTPERVDARLRQSIGSRAIGLAGERSLGMRESDAHFANTGIRIPYQPGLLRRVLDAKVDVVVAEGFFQWTPAALIKCVTQQVPLVISYERTAHTERSCPPWRELYRKAVIRLTDSMACNGVLSRQYASDKLGMPAHRITTGQMAADVEHFGGRFREAKGGSGLCFLYVGSIIQRKGIAELIAAWRQFQTATPSAASLVLAGDGAERQPLQKLVHETGVQNVQFIGSVPYDGLPNLYNSADVFVMPTLEDNWSLVVPEAMASGLPVLCSIHNGCWPELIEPGRNGWTFDPHNPADTAAALHRCLARQSDLPAMGEASRQIVSRHTPATAAKAVLNACEIAIANRLTGSDGWTDVARSFS